MARNLIEDYGAFDNNAEKGGRNDAGSLLKRAFNFLTNRYLVLAAIFVTFGVIILIMTYPCRRGHAAHHHARRAGSHRFLL